MILEIPNKYFDREALDNTERRWDDFIKDWLTTTELHEIVTFKNSGYDQMIIDTGEDFSICSHHILPIMFDYYVGYIPDKRLCGLSKIARVVRNFAHRPQMQEKLTQEIADFLNKNLKPKGVIVVIKGIHLCKKMRGVRVPGKMITSAVKGVFATNEENCKEEFLRLINHV